MLSWKGYEGLHYFDVRTDCIEGPGQADTLRSMGALVKLKGGEDGVREREVLILLSISDTKRRRRTLTTVAQMIKEANDEVFAQAKAYSESYGEFRGRIKNDLDSLKAATDGVEKNVFKMRKAYSDAVAILTSPEFNLAIENAERLAVALKSMSELQPHNITFAVLDKKTT